MAQVELKNIRKVYSGNVEAIKGADITIQDKEFVVLVGPSGCGKSTLLRMIAGLEEITSGDMMIGETRVNDLSPKDRDIAMVFQNYALYPHMTVYDNMAFGLKLRKYPKAEIKQRVAEAAKILGLEDFLKRRPKAMSGGQRQRVAIGRAIVRQPKVFLFDEPLSNLDAKLRVQMRMEIKRLHQQLQATMVYVTHDQVEAMTMGDKIVVLKDGVVQQMDTPINLYDNPANKFVGSFIGSPAMNFINGKITSGWTFKAEGIEFPIPEQYHAKLKAHPSKNIILGIRPEGIYNVNYEKVRQLTEAIAIKVNITEPIGAETFLYFDIGTTPVCMRSTSGIRYQVNENIEIGLNKEKLYFFDIETEIRVA